jgi:apolipoprotein N-acyltransferase
MSIIGRAIVGCWCLIFLLVMVSAVFPRTLTWVPHLELIRIFLPLLLLFSVAYALYRLYRQGMKRAHRD